MSKGDDLSLSRSNGADEDHTTSDRAYLTTRALRCRHEQLSTGSDALSRLDPLPTSDRSALTLHDPDPNDDLRAHLTQHE